MFGCNGRGGCFDVVIVLVVGVLYVAVVVVVVVGGGTGFRFPKCGVGVGDVGCDGGGFCRGDFRRGGCGGINNCFYGGGDNRRGGNGNICSFKMSYQSV